MGLDVTLDMDDVERIRIRTGGGPDNIFIRDLSGTGVTLVAIDLALSGGIGDGEVDTLGTVGSHGDDKITVSASGDVVSITGLPALVTFAHVDGVDALRIIGGDGNDVINAATVPGSKLLLNFEGNYGNDIIIGNAGDNDFRGDLGNDTLRGNAGSDTLDGWAGDDRLDAGAGDDTVHGGDGNDILLGGTGDDLLSDSGGDDTMNGGAGNDNLDGGYGNDVMIGGAGNDRFLGWEGDDTITGGTGNDTVIYVDYFGSSQDQDVFLDFDGNPADGQDTLDFNLLFDSYGVATADRGGRVSIVDNGPTVEVRVNADGNIGNGFEMKVTLHTLDTITVGSDVIVGTF